jgi:hypothetical protein
MGTFRRPQSVFTPETLSKFDVVFDEGLARTTRGRHLSAVGHKPDANETGPKGPCICLQWLD